MVLGGTVVVVLGGTVVVVLGGTVVVVAADCTSMLMVKLDPPELLVPVTT